jgi:hypothetical protein
MACNLSFISANWKLKIPYFVLFPCNLDASPKYYSDDQIKDDTGGERSTHVTHENCIQYFGWKTWREETIWKT